MAFPLMAAAPANSRGVSLVARSSRLRHVILPLGNGHEEEAAREWLALIRSLAGDHPEIINRVRKLQFLPLPIDHHRIQVKRLALGIPHRGISQIGNVSPTVRPSTRRSYAAPPTPRFSKPWTVHRAATSPWEMASWAASSPRFEMAKGAKLPRSTT